MSKSFGIHWFRRDLRLQDNLSLKHNLIQNEGRVLGLFCFDSAFLQRPDFSHNRFAFFLKTLEVLKNEMTSMGGDLLIVDRQPNQFFDKLISKLACAPSLVTFNRDYEPFARHRDEEIVASLQNQNILVKTSRDHLLFEPHEILKDDGKNYQIYSPYAKRWFEKFLSPDGQNRLKISTLSLREEINSTKKIFTIKWSDVFERSDEHQNTLEHFVLKNQNNVNIEIPDAGHWAARAHLKNFVNILDEYKEKRDIPSLKNTSKMSIYLKNGSITIAQIIYLLGLENEVFKIESSRSRYLKELVWREFYYSILWHHPDVEHEAFLKKFKNIKWENDKTHFNAWCQGKTGFPIVDAAMRELNTTGWMHNRARMIVASFLTKDLHIDWRWGEQYFMKFLLDGDLAANNGGWQWAASTGCDPQPYFRIFNPELQSKKFDPEGNYIRKFVAELKDVDSKNIHRPSKIKGYPDPIVDHAKQKSLAVKLYSSV